MAVRPILHYPDKRLRDPGKPVTEFDDELRQLIDDMAETMYAAPGVGLAAPQIGVALRLFIVDVATDDDEPSDLRVFANPEIIECIGTTTRFRALERRSNEPNGCAFAPRIAMARTSSWRPKACSRSQFNTRTITSMAS